MKHWRKTLVGGGAACGVVFIVASAVGSMGYFHFGNPQHTCASCHEMDGVHSQWSQSAHRTLHCRNCHGGSITLDLHALRSHVNRVVQHVTGAPDAAVIRLAERDVLRVHDSCRACHPQSFADWQAGPHAANYAKIFLDPAHNRNEQPAADCLRCHGMFFDGGIADLVAPLDVGGPWSLLDPAKAVQPTMPCLACHQIHTPAGATQPPHLYDHRERRHFAAASLPVAAVVHDGADIHVSRDPRQRLCVQCHAPGAVHQLGTSDDRTTAGVHEGLSCKDCHQSHTQSAKRSCAACHPADSHCGIDVEKMDTSFFDPTSRHNIHTVACQDCHPGGVPESRKQALKRP